MRAKSRSKSDVLFQVESTGQKMKPSIRQKLQSVIDELDGLEGISVTKKSDYAAIKYLQLGTSLEKRPQHRVPESCKSPPFFHSQTSEYPCVLKSSRSAIGITRTDI